MYLKKKNKDFQTLGNQIKRLSLKYKLDIKDKAMVEKYLLYHNYFDIINGLEDLFLNKNEKDKPKNFEGYSFDDFVIFYDINVDLRTFGLKTIAEFETKLRSLIAYYFNEVLYRTNDSDYDVLAYIDVNNFLNPAQGNELEEIRKKFDLLKNKQNVPNKYSHLVDFNSPLSVRLYKNCYMMEKMSKRNLFHDFDIPPFWVAIKEFDFGDLIKFLSLCKDGVDVKSSF